jgi:hypothetical protein
MPLFNDNLPFDLEVDDLGKYTIKDMKEYLTYIDSTHTFKTRHEYVERLKLYKNVLKFTWRSDQKHVLHSFLYKFGQYQYYVINGIFGCGKTTLLMGMLIHGIIYAYFKARDVVFLSFNVCIRNELKQKLRGYGIGSKVKVRTFDSLIYEICKLYEYPYLDLPNYEGKRKFCYKICSEIACGETEKKILSIQPNVIFIDETQDLEKDTFLIFQTFFSDSKIIFAGDVFQSIQKEPRETLLWYLLNTEIDKLYKTYMEITPRVPQNILKTLQSSLSTHYPEFKEKIQGWKSDNKISEANVEWNQFDNYTHVFNKIKMFLSTYDPTKCMILCFSSAITVKGAMGDIARFRKFLLSNGYDVNKNHKRMDHDKLFLSTANSSKGLERDYVLAVLTFPLEKAFSNFSNDIVVNLITVAMTRAKKQVFFYVPSYIDKFSISLNLYDACPKPTDKKIREEIKCIKDYTFSDYMNMEHCVTELLRQQIIKYDTIIKLKENIKIYDFGKAFQENAPKSPKIETDEDKSFVGILIENLITSSWVNEWPSIEDLDYIKSNPMYAHCFKRIEKIHTTYKKYIHTHSIKNNKDQFTGIYYYSQVHLAMYNKIFIDLSEATKKYIENYWISFKPNTYQLKPKGEINIQSNMRMPWITGVADVLVKNKNGEYDDFHIVELKASVDPDWKDNALVQAALYALMTGKIYTHLTILNPFRNEYCSYYFNAKNIMSIRNMILQDVLLWNMNCFLAKSYTLKEKKTSISDKIFVDKQYVDEKLSQYSVIHFCSPTKVEFLANVFVHTESKKETKLEKLCMESSVSEEEAILALEKLLNSAQYREKKVIETSTELDVETCMNYIPNETLKYYLNYEESLIRNITSVCYMSTLSQLV